MTDSTTVIETQIATAASCNDSQSYVAFSGLTSKIVSHITALDYLVCPMGLTALLTRSIRVRSTAIPSLYPLR